MANPAKMEPGLYYHVYNRGTNGENLFLEERNYRHFLNLYAQYIEPVAGTCAYCLLRNHFHLLVWVYPPEEKRQVWAAMYPADPFVDKSVSHAFANLFNAYSQAINHAYGRTGSLFEHPYHRIQVQSDAHFNHLVSYIHHNPRKHGFVEDFREWPFSSYRGLGSEQPTRLKRSTVMDWFGGPQGFFEAHAAAPSSAQIRYLVQEDEA